MWCTWYRIQKIGLDIAADANYDLETNKDSGANAWPYVGYDKSFNINVSDGGKTTEDIKAVLSGIELKKDCEYSLEFDYSIGTEIDMTIKIDGNNEHYSKLIKTSKEKTHFADKFTCNSDDANAKIEFLFGGQGNCNLTLSNIKLVKLS